MALGLRFLHRFSPLFPRNPFFPALRSGRLFQGPSPQKQIPSSSCVLLTLLLSLSGPALGVNGEFGRSSFAAKIFHC